MRGSGSLAHTRGMDDLDQALDLIADRLDEMQVGADDTHIVGQMRASDLSSVAWLPTTLMKSMRLLPA
jgi:hypothetical protein